ncbi:hypothetical protein FGO68_gene8245 [Halteria grandinella]|uniref:Uncharacterized protein n=1 Tax=Halteria grandinella TaxID=5974 RepID=A0A8J8T1F6_HALGN|nr:hypothetical protein FGO68_gene8245 [Halteria grandinella]
MLLAARSHGAISTAAYLHPFSASIVPEPVSRNYSSSVPSKQCCLKIVKMCLLSFKGEPYFQWQEYRSVCPYSSVHLISLRSNFHDQLLTLVQHQYCLNPHSRQGQVNRSIPPI